MVVSPSRIAGGVRARAPRAAQLPPRPNGSKPGGPNPFLVLGAAFLAGIAVAKLLDWRGRAQRR